MWAVWCGGIRVRNGCNFEREPVLERLSRFFKRSNQVFGQTPCALFTAEPGYFCFEMREDGLWGGFFPAMTGNVVGFGDGDQR